MRGPAREHVFRFILRTTLILGIASSTVLDGRQDAPGPPLPVAASSVAVNPEAYLGKYVSLVGLVERHVSSTAFVVEQGVPKMAGKGVLILTPGLNAPLDPNTRVTVIGNLVQFDPAEIAAAAEDHPLDFGPDLIEKYRGWPTVLAVSVIDAGLNEFVKRVHAPGRGPHGSRAQSPPDHRLVSGRTHRGDRCDPRSRCSPSPISAAGCISVPAVLSASRRLSRARMRGAAHDGRALNLK